MPREPFPFPAMPKLSANSRIIGGKRELTVRASPGALTSGRWPDRPCILDDIIRNPTVRELMGLPEAKAFAARIPQGRELIVYSEARGEHVKLLEVRFVDDADSVLAVSRWTRKKGFSFEMRKPLSEARWDK